MTVQESSNRSTKDLSEAIRAGQLSSVEIVGESLKRIAAENAELHAFTDVFHDNAMKRARMLDEDLAAGRWHGPLHGLPIAVKDLADIAGTVTGFGSRCYSKRPATVTAPFVLALEEAGAVIVGKTHTVEFAFGSWGTNYALGTPVNPAGPGHLAPGGSSSGSAVAVASGMVPLAIGSDTGGSVRIPAALCGIAGLKPSHGLTPLEGVAPLSPAFDTIGPLARDVAGLSFLFDALCTGPKPRESSPRPVRFRYVSISDLEPLDACIATQYDAYLSDLSHQGLPMEPLSLPFPLAEYQHRCGQLMARDAYQALHWIIDDPAAPVDPWVRRRIEAGRDISDAAHEVGWNIRSKDILNFLERFGPDDVLVLPTTPFPTRPIAEIDEAEFPMSRFTRLANYLDLTAASLPLWQVEGRPAGLQFVMRRDQDDRLLKILRAGAPDETG